MRGRKYTLRSPDGSGREEKENNIFSETYLEKMDAVARKPINVYYY